MLSGETMGVSTPLLTLKGAGTKTGVRGPWSRLTGEKISKQGKVRRKSRSQGELSVSMVKHLYEDVLKTPGSSLDPPEGDI